MGLFDWFRKKKEHPGHILDDEDRRIGVETRLLRSRIKKERDNLELERMRLEHEVEMTKLRAELDELRDDFDDEEDEPEGTSNEALLASVLMPMLQRQQAPPAQQAPAPVLPSKRTYSDAEISTLLEAIPKNMRKVVKKLPEEALIARAQQYAPDADENTISRALEMIKKF